MSDFTDIEYPDNPDFPDDRDFTDEEIDAMFPSPFSPEEIDAMFPVISADEIEEIAAKYRINRTDNPEDE